MKNTTKFIIIAGVILFLVFILNWLYSNSRYKISSDITKNNIKLSSIFKIKEENVNYLNTYVEDDKIVGFDCLLDSSLYIKVYNFGKLNKGVLSDIVIQSNKDNIDPNIILNTVLCPPNKYQHLYESYNVSNLQYNSINKIELFIGDKFEKKNINNTNTIGFEAITSNITLYFNDKKQTDFSMSGLKSKVGVYFHLTDEYDILFIYVNSLPQAKSTEFDKLGF